MADNNEQIKALQDAEDAVHKRLNRYNLLKVSNEIITNIYLCFLQVVV